jgi:hypothetical protein
MLIAAMILGLVGGTIYFVGGGAGSIVLGDGGSAPWWVIALIPIGAAGVMGGALVRVNSVMAGIILLLAAAAAISVGFASYEEAWDTVIRQGTTNYYLIPTGILSQHAFLGPLIYLPVPLLSLIIGGALALSAGKRPSTD